MAGFAAELRRLRLDTDGPSFRAMARSAHYSASTLAEATRGVRLPSRGVVEAFVTACGADPREWLARLDEAARQAQAAAASPAAGDEAPSPGAGVPRWSGGGRARRTAAMGTALAVGLGTGLLTGAWMERGQASPAGRAAVPVPTHAPTPRPAANGQDPVTAGCAGDARLLDKAPVLEAAAQIGALELRYSVACRAGWARAYLYPGQPSMRATVEVSTPDGHLARYGAPLDRQVPIFTDVVVPAEHCLRARAVFEPPGRPPITTTIPCDAPPAA